MLSHTLGSICFRVRVSVCVHVCVHVHICVYCIGWDCVSKFNNERKIIHRDEQGRPSVFYWSVVLSKNSNTYTVQTGLKLKTLCLWLPCDRNADMRYHVQQACTDFKVHLGTHSSSPFWLPKLFSPGILISRVLSLPERALKKSVGKAGPRD